MNYLNLINYMKANNQTVFDFTRSLRIPYINSNFVSEKKAGEDLLAFCEKNHCSETQFFEILEQCLLNKLIKQIPSSGENDYYTLAN